MLEKLNYLNFYHRNYQEKKGDIIEISAKSEIYKNNKKSIEEKAKKIVYVKQDGIKVGNHDGAYIFHNRSKKKT